MLSQFDEKQCIQLFNRYADTDTPDLISPEGTRQFFEDLGVSIEDVSFCLAEILSNALIDTLYLSRV